MITTLLAIVLLPWTVVAVPMISPVEVALVGPESTQQLVVTQETENGLSDLTHEAKYRSKNEAVAIVNEQGIVRPVGEGITEVRVSSSVGTKNIPVRVQGLQNPKPISFRRDIQPILTKAACNSGGCHGKADGQNGFKLSLFGFDDEFDFAAVVKAARGRRVNISAPDRSLFLRKATGDLPHGGGRKIETSGLWYARILRWLREGAKLDEPNELDTVRLEIYPAAASMRHDSGQQLQVFAVDSDGTRRCVTREAEFISNATDVAEVDSSGLVQVSTVPGEAAILARYRGVVSVARVRLPQGGNVARPVLTHPIDVLVWDRFSLLGIRPSELVDDADFLRRVYLDSIGTLPTVEEARAFLSNRALDKREKLIDDLLRRSEYADFWAMKWADILRVDRERIQSNGTIAMTRWLRYQFANNRPYDEFVTAVITAVGSTVSESPAAFYVVHNDAEKMARSISQAFLGVRIECAQCHHHPFEKWGQHDYFAFAGFFTGVKQKKMGAQAQKILDGPGQDLAHPRTQQIVPAAGLGAGPAMIGEDVSRRTVLAAWMTKTTNPFLARMLVNRLWAHYFGRGLADPIDDMRSTNPASNEPLLNMLADRFIENGFDVKKITKFILTSRVYQLSSDVNQSNELDEQNFSHARWKAMSAEVLLDAISQATGISESFNGWPEGYRAIQVWDNRMPNYFFRIFGKPRRVSVCECERGTEPSIAQALHLMNAPETMSKLRSRFGAVRRLVESNLSESEIVDELYLSTLSRFPTTDERELMVGVFDDPVSSRQTAVEDILWTLINTREFVFNH
ncbi:MAG: DUF1553 domain-containing protein [Planctomycetaceae bacterium]|nr:DUF1553 domain-containing protein [Planctomycetaceae bacterium]MBT5123264.1 DUF1553 domain-containing protein [Planctomycetaceae bacterium]